MARRTRIAVFIDGANLNQAQGSYQQGYKVDLVKLVDRLIRGRKLSGVLGKELTVTAENELVAVNYYGSERGSRQTRFAKIRQAYNFRFHQYKLQKQVDVALAIDMLDNAWRELYDTAILVSGDQDFVPAVNRVRRLGKEVEVVSFENSLSSSLKREASVVTVLDPHADYIRMA